MQQLSISMAKRVSSLFSLPQTQMEDSVLTSMLLSSNRQHKTLSKLEMHRKAMPLLLWTFFREIQMRCLQRCLSHHSKISMTSFQHQCLPSRPSLLAIPSMLFRILTSEERHLKKPWLNSNKSKKRLKRKRNK